MSDTRNTECRRNCWYIAAGAGLLTLLMMWLVGTFGFFASLIFGLIVFAALGFFLGWAFCTGAEASAGSATASPAHKASAAAAPATAASASSSAGQSAAASAGATPTPAPKPEPVAAPKPAAAEPAPKAPEPAPAPKPAAAAPAKPASAGTGATGGLDSAIAKSKDDGAGGSPEMLSAPIGGKADDLKQIKGVGPKLEALLNQIGVWHFSQVASWKAKDIAFVDEKLEGFKGRIARDNWVSQAKELAKGSVRGGN